MNRSGAVHLDTTEVPASEREEFVRASIAQAVIPLDLEHRHSEGQIINMRLDAADLGPLTLQTMRMSAIAARRTERLARDNSPPSLFVIAKRTGSSAVVHDGRETVVGPGELILVLSTQPSLVLSDQSTRHDSLQIPLQHLALPEPMLHPALALRLGSELPLASVLGGFVDSLTTVADVQPAEAQHLARVAVDLVRGLITTVLGAPSPAHTDLDATPTPRLVDYLRAHWPQQDHLTADRLAQARHISTRQLHQLLAAQGFLDDRLR